MIRKILAPILFTVIISVTTGCSVAPGTSSGNSGGGSSNGGTAVATEVWKITSSYPAGTTGSLTLSKSSDGSISVSGSWTNVSSTYGTTTCPFAGGYATVNGNNFYFTGSGTAYNGSSQSAFTATLTNSIATNGYMYANFSVIFKASGWTSMSGTIYATRISGSNITTNLSGGGSITGNTYTNSGIIYTNIGSTWSVLTNNGPSGNITILSSINGLPVVGIGNYAFYQCNNLAGVVIPSSINTIGVDAFANCYLLTNVSIPASVTNIGSYAFDWCTNLTIINVDSGNAIYSSLGGILFNKNQTSLIQCPAGLNNSYSIPGTVTIIGNDAFAGSSLSGITIPSSVTSIGTGAFWSCTLLTTLTIPSGVTSIGSSAFGYSGLTAIVVNPATPPSLGVSAFVSCSGLTAIKVLSGSVTAYQTASGWSAYSSKIVSQ